jgi:hypothetical protein
VLRVILEAFVLMLRERRLTTQAQRLARPRRLSARRTFDEPERLERRAMGQFAAAHG